MVGGVTSTPASTSLPDVPAAVAAGKRKQLQETLFKYVLWFLID
jgi:hypothetical protein